jgi:RNA polymerase sigma-70 factor (ECF subfamily)
MIAGAQSTDAPKAVAQLDRLARTYWRPLYAYVRGTGRTHEQAADEVQAFFASLVMRDSLRHVQPGATRFRSFLLACLKNSLASAGRRGLAQKRGGNASHVPLDELESGVVPSLPDSASPQEALDRVWAQEIFDRAFRRLQDDAKERGREDIFAMLRPILLGTTPEGGYAAVGADLGVAEGTARKMVFDLRVRLGEFLRQEVLQTVAQPEDVEDELRYLLGLL